MKLDSPYRAQELRPPVAPARSLGSVLVACALTLGNLIAFAFAALFVNLFAPHFVLLSELLAMASGALLIVGVARARRDGIRRGASCFGLAALLGMTPATHYCAVRREASIITAVHAWAHVHGHYPESLREVALPRRPLLCYVAPPPIVNGRVLYHRFPTGEDAGLIRGVFVFLRRTYDFQDRRFGSMD